MSSGNKKTSTEISMDYPLYKSEKGKYFIGQTPILSGQTGHALVALKNQLKSNRIIYLNSMTITNISALNLSAEFYLTSTFINGDISNLVSCTNTNISPEPIHRGQIEYLTSVDNSPKYGIPIFSRIVSPYSTSVIDAGQIVLGPGKSIIIYIGGFLKGYFDSIRFAFGWWEEETCTCYNGFF